MQETRANGKSFGIRTIPIPPGRESEQCGMLPMYALRPAVGHMFHFFKWHANAVSKGTTAILMDLSKAQKSSIRAPDL